MQLDSREVEALLQWYPLILLKMRVKMKARATAAAALLQAVLHLLPLLKLQRRAHPHFQRMERKHALKYPLPILMTPFKSPYQGAGALQVPVQPLVVVVVIRMVIIILLAIVSADSGTKGNTSIWQVIKVAVVVIVITVEKVVVSVMACLRVPLCCQRK